MVGIYTITNKKDGMTYVGQSINILQRWRGHRKDANHLDSHMYRSMRKYGLDNFEFKVLRECRKDELDELEIYYIKKLNTITPNGYNVSTGGSNGSVGVALDYETVQKIKKELPTAESSTGLANKYQVSLNTISSINLGNSWYEDDTDYPIRDWFNENKNKCVDCEVEISAKATRCRPCHLINARVAKGPTPERPSAEELEKLLWDTNFTEVGRKFGVSDNAVRKWCLNYGMSNKAADYKPPVKKKEKQVVFNPDSMFPLTFLRKGKELSFTSRKEMIEYIQKEGISKGTYNSILKSIGRMLSGKRNSYLGFTLKEEV